MSDFCPPATSFVFHRSYFNVINEMDTDAEKLAAFMTLCQMAFQGEEAFSLPELPVSGRPTPVLHAIRNLYHQSRDFIWQKSKPKSERHVAAGKRGGRPRRHAAESDSWTGMESAANGTYVECTESNENAPTRSSEAKEMQPPKEDLTAILPQPARGSTANPIGSPEIVNGIVQSRFASIVKAPSDLKSWLRQNWIGSRREMVFSDGFIEWAFEKLVNSGWRDYKTNRPITNLNAAVGAMIYGYEKYVKYVIPKQEAEEADRKRQEAEKKNEELTEADRYEIRRKRLEKAEPYE